jgi:hypothetical protein
MAGLSEMVRWQRMEGEPTTVGELTITPESQALMVRWPGRWQGGYVWNRPVAVLVERDGQQERIPIVDVTRVARLGLLLSSAALAFIMMVISGRRKEQSE